MPHVTRRSLSFLLLAAVLFSLGAVPAAWSAPAGPDLMPPNPRLRDLIESGQLQAPNIIDEPNADMLTTNGVTAVEALSGPVRSLAVVVDFSDKVKTVSASFFDSLIYAAPVAGRGSVADYYKEVTYGQVDIVTVNLPSALGWVRAPQTYAYYVYGAYCTDGVYPHNCQKLAEDVVDAINGVVNFADYDNNNDGVTEPIMLIHAGPGAEFTGSANDVWSHSWSLRSPRSYDGKTISKYVIMPEYWLNASSSASDMTVGVFVHEMGHGFWGLPDLYDTDGSSEGIGNWSLMAGGSWNGPANLCDGTGCYHDGSSPAWPDAWTRIKMGYSTATSVAANVTGQSIPEVLSSATVLKLANSTLASTEYFLVENRQKTAGSYDEYLPGPGLAIWHIDTAKTTNASECTLEPHSACGSTHYMVALEQADGLHELESGVDRGDAGDVFPGSTNNRTFNFTSDPGSSSYYSTANTNIAVANISNSAATMTADLQVAGAPTLSINNATVTEGNSGTVNANFTISLSAPAVVPVTVNWATANGTAAAGSDYVAGSGSVSFAIGESSKPVTVVVNGDTTVESNETFYVNLSGASGAQVTDAQGLGTITNDDVTAATLHVGDLDGAKSIKKSSWTATVTVLVHDQAEKVVASAVVSALWSGSSTPVTCTTGRTGTCSISKASIPLTTTSVTLTVQGITKSGYTYAGGLNHDIDGGTNGTVITVTK